MTICQQAQPKTTFLANSNKKMRLIQTLCDKIRDKQAEAGATTLIVSTAQAVAESEQVPVVVVGTDTDLTGHASCSGNHFHRYAHAMPQ